MEHVAPVILPEMHRIFVQSNTYTIRTRGRAVEIFDTCATLIFNIAAVSKVTPTFIQTLVLTEMCVYQQYHSSKHVQL